ncbi:MAG: PRC-barrel domain-containing protein [Gemmatimonadaceae bacterium]
MARKKSDRSARDVAGLGPDPKQTRHLMPLRELKKFRIASGEPDVRGWNVFTSAGREIGEVEDLLVDPTRGEVVMLDVELTNSDRHTLAPLRAAWIDRDTKRVILDGAHFNADEEIPSLTRGSVSDEDARRFGERYERAYGDRGWENDTPYTVRRSNEELRFGRRRSDAQRTQPAAPATDVTSSTSAKPGDERVRETAPGVTETVVERRTLPADDAEAAALRREEADWHDVRFPARADRPQVVEEVVVRRRLLDEERGPAGGA